MTCPPQNTGSATGLTRVTANLTAPAVRDLDHLVTTTGLNRTDLINTAIRLLAHLQPDVSNGSIVILRVDGTQERLVLL